MEIIILLVFSLFIGRVLHGSIVECVTSNPGALGSSITGSSGFFSWESVFGQDTLVKPRKDVNIMSCRCDMTEILLNAAKKLFNYVSLAFINVLLKFH